MKILEIGFLKNNASKQLSAYPDQRVPQAKIEQTGGKLRLPESPVESIAELIKILL